METDLVCLVYTSRLNTDRCDEEEIQTILEHSVNNNRKLGISGMLLYSDGAFLQALEGPKDAVKKTFERIKVDRRHDSINKLAVEAIEQRRFPDRAMGFASLSRSELAQIPGVGDLISASQSLSEVRVGTAKFLLEAFLKRHWRERLG